MNLNFPEEYPIICPKEKNSTQYWDGSDNEHSFNITKKHMPTEWVYHKKPITYKSDSLGFRNDIDFHKLDVSKSVAFVGCSHIEGQGNTHYNTIPAMYEKQTKIPTYNMGLSGMDNFVIFFNALWAIQQGFKKVYVFWTDATRNCLLDKNGRPYIFLAQTMKDLEYRKYFQPAYMVENSHWEMRKHLYTTTLKNFSSDKTRVEVFEMFSDTEHSDTLHSDTLREEVWGDIRRTLDMESMGTLTGCISNIHITNKLWARDIKITKNNSIVSHFGPMVNETVAKKLVKKGY